MRKLLIYIIFFLFLIPVPKTEANHVCGQDCNQYTEQGACTHGCYAGGDPNPDFRRVIDYQESTDNWTNTYNQIKQQERDAADLAATQQRANEAAAAAAAAQAAADAAAANAALQAEADKKAAEAADALRRAQQAEALNIIQTERDKNLIKTGGCMQCVNCPDDHLHPWCAQIPGGHNPASQPKGNGDFQTLFTYDPNNPDALKDEAERIINYNQSNNIVGREGVSNYFIKADGSEAYLIEKGKGSGNYIVSDTPIPILPTDCSSKSGEELKNCLVNMALGASYFVGVCSSASSCALQSGWFYQICTCPGGLSQDPNIKGQCRMNCQRSSRFPPDFLGGCAGQIDVCSDDTCAAGAGLKGFIISSGTSQCVPPPVSTPEKASSSVPPPSVFDTPTPTPTPTAPPGGPTPTPPPGSSFQCQQVKVFRNNVEITTADIQLGDTIVFRGFASAVNITVSKLRFTLTKGGVPQTPVDVNTTLVGGQYQADYTINIDTATSYSVTAVPVSP